jgi:hypothetical protein
MSIELVDVVKSVTLLLNEVLASYLCSGAAMMTEASPGFVQSLHPNAAMTTATGPRLLPSTFHSIHYSLVILQFEAR